MYEFILENYLTIKALHIIAVVSWFAGLFYLPRLFIYHTQEHKIKGLSAVFQTMERKLYKFIMTPAMILTYIFGSMMLYVNSQLLLDGFSYFHIKLTLVILLTGYHHSLPYFMRLLKDDNYKFSHKFFRFYNEIPTVFLIVIVFLAITKPF